MDGIPITRKLGYDHAVEMAKIESGLRGFGLTGVELYFAAIRTYENLHKNDPTWRERQEKWLATQDVTTPTDLFKLALEEIRDGHNNPRELARSVLEGIK